MSARSLLTIAGASLLLAACTPGDGTSGPDDRESPRVRPSVSVSEEIRFGVLGDVATLDPYAAQASDLTFALVRPVYPSLFRFLPDGSTEPYLAESIHERAAGVVIDLADMKWSDGSAIEASDVVASWRRAGPGSGLGRVTKARAASGDKVIFKGDAPDWEQALASNAFILPGGKAGNVYGGPYEISKRTPGLSIQYQPNPQWAGPDPLAKKVTVFSTETTGVLLSLLKSGRLDAAWLPSTINIEERLDATDLEFASALGWSSIRLEAGSGMSEDALTSIGASLDRSALEEAFIRDAGRVANSLHPEPGDGGVEGPYRPGGVQGTDPFVLATASGDELLGFLQNAVQLQLTAAGFEVELIDLPVSDLYASRYSEVSLVRAEGTPGLLDPEAAYDSAIPLFQVESFLAWNSGTGGPEVNPTSDGPLWNLERWSVSSPTQ